MPNYIPPVVYYASTYDSYGYGGDYSYSGGYVYSSGGGYSSSGGYYSNYVPQSAYYTKEAQLVAEEREYDGASTYSLPKTGNESAAWAPALGFGLVAAGDSAETIEVPPVAIVLGGVALVSLVVAGGIWLFSEHTKNARPSTKNKHENPRPGRDSTKNRSKKDFKSRSNKRRK